MPHLVVLFYELTLSSEYTCPLAVGCWLDRHCLPPPMHEVVTDIDRHTQRPELRQDTMSANLQANRAHLFIAGWMPAAQLFCRERALVDIACGAQQDHGARLLNLGVRSRSNRYEPAADFRNPCRMIRGEAPGRNISLLRRFRISLYPVRMPVVIDLLSSKSSNIGPVSKFAGRRASNGAPCCRG